MSVLLREVISSDLETFYLDQLEPEAIRMAAFASRDRNSFFTHWEKILANPEGYARTVLRDGSVAGNVVSWTDDDLRLIGYWIGKPHWGHGVATRAVELMLVEVPERPLSAFVAAHNAGSIRVLEKCGFNRETERELGLDDGIKHSEYLYTLRAQSPEP